MVLLYSAKTIVTRNYNPLFFNFLYAYSCSIKLFGYFITCFLYLTCSVHINAIFVNINLHVSTVYTLIIPKSSEFEN